MAGRCRNDGAEGGGYWWKVADFSTLQKINSLRLEETIDQLPKALLPNIYRHLDLTSLGQLALTNKVFAPTILKYLLEDASIGQILYSFVPVKRFTPSNQAQRYKYGVKTYRVVSPAISKRNFRELGVALKRLTMLKATHDRLIVIFKFISNFSLIPQCSNKEICELFAIFLHTFMFGWFEGESEFAIITLMRTPLGDLLSNDREQKDVFSSVMTQVQTVLHDDYNLGDDLEGEKNLRNFLHAIFYPASTLKLDRTVWFKLMLKVFVPNGDVTHICKLLLLTTAALKKSPSANLQWQDSAEAVPACIRVATFRYEELVKAVITLSNIPRYKDLHVKIMLFIFIEPDVWLPENKASFLLLAGPEMTKDYLRYVVTSQLKHHAGTGKPFNEHMFRSLGDIFMGLYTMQSRFNRCLTPVLTRLDEVLCYLPSEAKPVFLKAVWGSLTRELGEVLDLLEEEEDQLSQDSRHHLKVTMSRLGAHLTMKAFGPGSRKHNHSKHCQEEDAPEE